MRGVLRLQFAKNEARLVPILHNGRVPPPECICPPRVQLTLVTKGIMDIRFQQPSVGQSGSPLALGASCRGFKSLHSDQFGFLFVGISLPEGVAEKPRLDGKP